MATPLLSRLAWAAALALAPACGYTSVFGTLGNFDVVNDTGQTAHGFEIELEGLHPEDITDTFGGAGRGFPTDVERYGAPTVAGYSNGSVFGVRIRYQATFAGGAWDVGTPSGSLSTGGESCWKYGGINYGPSTPCDHFGVGTSGNATRTTYTWLVAASPNAPALTPVLATLPAPVWSVTPAPVVVGQPLAPPVVAARIEVPPAPEHPESQFGPAMWVKVFTTEFEDRVRLEDLVADNARIQLAKTKTEVEWQLLQTDPGNPAAGVLEAGYGVPVGKDAQSVVRRYEFYAYSGAFDPDDHEALVGSDSHPLDSELGNFLGAQNAAVNLQGNLAAVPEPQTWALLLAGLGGLALRRRGARPA